MHFALGLSLLISAAVGSPQDLAVATMPASQSVEEYVRDYFTDIPIMADVAQCESHFRQFDKDGSIHRGRVNNKDVGVMQINEYYHGDTAEKLGIDLYTVKGNLEYARYLYEKEGTTPWLSSGKCWSQSAHLAQK